MAECFTITTPRVHLSWSGPAVTSVGAGGLTVEAVAGAAEVRLGDGAVHTVDNRWTGPLRLFEEASYPVVLRSRTDAPVVLHHRDPVVVGGMTAAEGGRVQHGVVRFGAFVGKSRFVVLVGGRPEVVFSVTVAPRKVGEGDVAAMRREVEAALSGLAVRYLGATTFPVAEASEQPSRPVWLTHLRMALPALEQALSGVARRPREQLRRTTGLACSARLTRPDAAVRRAVMQGLGAGTSAPVGELPIRERLPAQPLLLTRDTPEHRWLRARVEAAAHRLALVRQEEATMPHAARRERTREELGAMALRLHRLLALPPLAEAKGPPPLHLPLALHSAPGYAEARAALRRLDVGLALGEGVHEAVPRDLAGLYEVWSYLTVARTLAEVLGQPLPADPFFAVTARGVRLRLRRGRRHALRMKTAGLAVSLAYEPRFSAAPGLLAQRPDLLLTVERPWAPPRLYVLDAKYRRDDAEAYRRRHGAPGPPEDALGTLHRYRDAIVTAGPTGVERPVEAAVALFPYREKAPGAFAGSRLWTSLSAIGVGAIPLLPGATGYLVRWLGDVLRDA